MNLPRCFPCPGRYAGQVCIRTRDQSSWQADAKGIRTRTVSGGVCKYLAELGDDR